VDAGLLAASDLPAPCYQLNVDWEYVVKEKEPLLGKAAKALLASSDPKVCAVCGSACLCRLVSNLRSIARALNVARSNEALRGLGVGGGAAEGVRGMAC
jgi:hypothetical protein